MGSDKLSCNLAARTVGDVGDHTVPWISGVSAVRASVMRKLLLGKEGLWEGHHSRTVRNGIGGQKS